jgi:CubicO group peptidase (beta-lactamase class C family)
MRVVITTMLTALGGITLLAQAPAAPDFPAARQAAAALPQLYSLMASRRGEVILEHHARGHGAARHANIKSASKSVISTLAGIAIEQDHIPGLDTPIVRWFPELRKASDPGKQAITVEDLLTMRSGLDSTSGGNYGPWVNSRNWLRYALDRPMVSTPGTSMEYSTGTSHILSAVITRATKRSTRDYANEVLGKPLGFTFASWTRDPQGIYFGGNEMSMTPRQMLAYGELYLNRGRAGGRQVVPAGWVDRSCVPVTRSRYDSTREYGMGWWIQDIGGQRACFAWGYGGQYIMVFRELDLVVVVTSNPNVSDERRGYRRALFDLLRTHVLPAAAGINSQPPTPNSQGAR